MIKPKTLEHNQPAPAKAGVIKTADWIIDLGPEGGVKGGEIVAVGTPETVAAEPRSFTGQYLAPLLSKCPNTGLADPEQSRGIEALPSSSTPKSRRKAREREPAE